MPAVVLGSLRAHRGRFIATAVAVVLGVGFISGTLVFNDTASAGYYDTFARSAQGVDVAVEPTTENPIDPRQLDVVMSLSTVESAVGRMVVSLPMLDSRGRTIVNFGVSGYGVNTDGDPQLQPFALTGTLPAAEGEAALDVHTAARQHRVIGDAITVLDAQGARHTLHVVGLMDFGTSQRFSDHSVVGLPAAHLAALTGVSGYDEIVVRARPGVSQAEAATEVRAAVGPGVEVLTGDERRLRLADEATSSAGEFALIVLIFGLISLIVAAFVIYNTFAILLAQRVRQTALLRCVGASRRQIFGAAVAEAFVVGLLGALVGVVLGIAVAGGLLALLNGVLHAGIPAHAVVVRPPSIVVGLIVGTVVTLASALVPAARATRTAPMAALRDQPMVAATSSRRRAAVQLVGAALLGGAGALLTYLGSTVDDAETGTLVIVAGGVITFGGVLVAAPVYIGPLTALVGAVPARLLGVPARLAVANAQRNPGRTAATSATLMIGISLMALLVTIIGSTSETVSRRLVGHYPIDYVMVGIERAGAGDDATGGVPAGYAGALRERPEFSGVAETRVLPATVGGQAGNVAAIDAAGGLIKPDMSTGDVRDLGPGTAIVSAIRPATKGLHVGDTLTVAVSERQAQVRVVGTARLAVPGAPEADVLLSWDQLTALAGPGDDTTVMAKLAPGVTPTAGSDALVDLGDAYPLVQVNSIADLTSELRSAVNGLIALFAGLLGTSVLISLFGIANTLALSVLERRRESAVVRALGMTRSQLRATMFLEAVLMAVVGALVGVTYGLV